jgi:hypothetical protein
MTKEMRSVKPSWVKEQVVRFAQHMDKAITLGVTAAYPLLFSMEAPDPVPDWKQGVRFGWRVVRVTAKETFKVLKKGLP